jgi:hypothetical protein
MYKTFIAGITAVSLILSSAAPAQANGLDQKDVGQILFGLIVAATVAQGVRNHRTQTPALADVIVSQQPRSQGNGHNGPRYGQLNQSRVSVLPGRCVRKFDTRKGNVRMMTRRCIARHYDHAVNFPRRCERDVMTNRGFRSGWAMRCLRNNGFTVAGRR